MTIELVNLKREYAQYGREINEAIERVLKSGVYILGEEVASFEKEFAAFCEAKHCVALASGTDALLLSLKALGIKPGDEVITVAHTFVSTALTISQLGAKPVFADIDPATYTIDPKDVERKITKKTKAIIPVHLYGHPASMEALRALAQTHGLKIVEDACQAHGARYRGKRVGTLGDIAAFSFYPSKNLGGYGDGGAVVTDNGELAKKVRQYRTYGGIERDRYETDGINSRLDEVQAAVLRTKLARLERGNEKRRANAEQYRSHLDGIPITLPTVADGAESVYHQFVIRAKSRDELREYLRGKGIQTGVHYPTPVHLQPVYASKGHAAGELPVTEEIVKEIVSLPMCPFITEEELTAVADSTREFFEKN